MPNRNLTSDELKHANELLTQVRRQLAELAGNDPLLLFAYRTNEESLGPCATEGLKWGQQGGRCAHCNDDLALKYSELDRKVAENGYTPDNTELVHAKCHQERQAAKGYT
jgi:hypothetical protein